MIKKIRQFIAMYFVFSLIVSLGLLISSFPKYPKSMKEWLWLFLLALPITLVFELIGTFIWQNPLAKSIEKHTENSELSFIRIFYGLFCFLLLAAILIGVSYLAGINLLEN